MNEKIHGYVTLGNFLDASQFQFYKSVILKTLLFNIPDINSSHVPVGLHLRVWSTDFKCCFCLFICLSVCLPSVSA